MTTMRDQGLGLSMYKVKLNIGCRNHGPGAFNKDNGWTSIDIAEADICFDITQVPWPVNNDYCEAILASHVVEHIEKNYVLSFFKECYRVLKPNGVISIAVPDMDIFINCLIKNDWSLIGDYPHRDFNKLFGGDFGDINNYWHRYVYNYETLFYMLNDAGFKSIKQVDFKGNNDVFLGVQTPEHKQFSLYVEATKYE